MVNVPHSLRWFTTGIQVVHDRHSGGSRQTLKRFTSDIQVAHVEHLGGSSRAFRCFASGTIIFNIQRYTCRSNVQRKKHIKRKKSLGGP